MTSSQAAEAFTSFTRRVHAALPLRLRKFVPQTFIGFAIINLTTFLIDMLLLSLTVRVLHWHFPVAVSVSFAIAAGIAFLVNKFLNFRAHGQIGRQSGRYVLVLVSNYLIWILGFATLLNAVGAPPEVARVVAALCEGLYIYLLSRWWVFHRRA